MWSTDLEGTCKFSGYVPGGKRVILDPITSPHAMDQGNSLAQYAYFCDYGNTVTGAALDLASFGKKVGQYAEKLSAALGVWGAIVGGFLYEEPTTADIIDGVNSAFDRLTKQVNDQFDNMQEYVKQQILDLEKTLMNDKYKQYLNLFNLCLDYFDRVSLIGCLRNAHDESRSDQDSFMKYKEKMEAYYWWGFVAGAGISESQVKLPDLYDNKQSCFFACSKKMNEGYNGVTYGRGSHEKECYCEKSMVGVRVSDGANVIWESAYLVGTGNFQQGGGQFLEHTGLPGLYETKQTCFRACAEEKIRNSSYNGATYGIVGGEREKKCFCNKGMYGVDKTDRRYESAWLADFPARWAKMCKCKGGDKHGYYCGEWDVDGTWCYVEDPKRCDDAIQSGTSDDLYWSKAACKYYLASVDEVKHMEVQFLTFRNYAQLRLLMLMTIVATFDNTTDAEYSNSTNLYKRYLNHLREESDLYIRYANFVYDQILFMHNACDGWVDSKLYCDQSHGLNKYWQYDYCHGQFSPMLIDTDTCTQAVYLFTKEWGTTSHCPCDGYDNRERFALIPPTADRVRDIDMPKTFTAYASYRMMDQNEENFYKYRKDATKSVVNFWTAEVISQLDVWKDILHGTLQKLEAVKSIDVNDLKISEMYDQHMNKPAANDKQEDESEIYEEQKDELR